MRCPDDLQGTVIRPGDEVMIRPEDGGESLMKKVVAVGKGCVAYEAAQYLFLTAPAGRCLVLTPCNVENDAFVGKRLMKLPKDEQGARIRVDSNIMLVGDNEKRKYRIVAVAPDEVFMEELNASGELVLTPIPPDECVLA